MKILGPASLIFIASVAFAQQPNSIVLGSAGYQVPSPVLDVAPGQLIVLHVHGISTTFDSNVAPVPGPNGFPHALNGVSVDLVQGKSATPTSLELHAAYQTHCLQPCSSITGVTLQVPFELETDYVAKGDPAPILQVSENGKVVGGVSLHPVSDNVHIVNTCDDSQIYISAAYSVPQNVCAADVMDNGLLNSLYNLAHGGDEIAVWLYGMGAVTAQAPGCCVSPDQLSKPVQPFQLNFDFRPNAPASPAVPGFGVTAPPLFAVYVAGLYQVNLQVPPVPSGLPACDGVKIKSNLTITFTGPNSYDAAQICVAP